jgi:hypothetical protein
LVLIFIEIAVDSDFDPESSFRTEG